jgi:hypothetical protein
VPDVHEVLVAVGQRLEDVEEPPAGIEGGGPEPLHPPPALGVQHVVHVEGGVGLRLVGGQLAGGHGRQVGRVLGRDLPPNKPVRKPKLTE